MIQSILDIKRLAIKKLSMQTIQKEKTCRNSFQEFKRNHTCRATCREIKPFSYFTLVILPGFLICSRPHAFFKLNDRINEGLVNLLC